MCGKGSTLYRSSKKLLPIWLLFATRVIWPGVDIPDVLVASCIPDVDGFAFSLFKAEKKVFQRCFIQDCKVTNKIEVYDVTMSFVSTI